ncbi:iron-sulfur cluster assembly protein [Actinoplanes sp. NPDC051411]|uniref:iron-sulfur cluster assembly protein n=1 Tax=Actinoplanes sp. NPDC051411 TaxID=3155522 RepID=UPI003437E3D3
MTLLSAVTAALGSVRDPELDRPLTDLGFVSRITIKTPSGVRVELRLPTYFCAPNFAWLMVADARDAVAAVPGAGPVEVVLLDHFVSAEINEGVAAASSFADAFASDDVDSSLASLRTTFERKAHLAASERLSRSLLAAGVPAASLPALSLAAASSSSPADAAAVSQRRERLGIESSWAFCDDRGDPFDAGRLPRWLRFARTVRVSIEGNAGFCRGLLETRYRTVVPDRP